jgi:hypothetical protein
LELFEEAANLSRPQTQVSNSQLTLGEYDGIRLLGVEGRVQVDLSPEVDSARGRAVGAAVLSQLVAYRPTALGLNAVLRIELDEGETDPTEPLLDLDRVAERLSATPVRGGLKVVYSTDDLRTTLGIDPDLDDASAWIASANRHYERFPEEPEQGSALDWFVSADFEAQLRELLDRGG